MKQQKKALLEKVELSIEHVCYVRVSSQPRRQTALSNVGSKIVLKGVWQSIHSKKK